VPALDFEATPGLDNESELPPNTRRAVVIKDKDEAAKRQKTSTRRCGPTRLLSASPKAQIAVSRWIYDHCFLRGVLTTQKKQ